MLKRRCQWHHAQRATAGRSACQSRAARAGDGTAYSARMTVPVPYVNLRVPFSAFRPASYFAFDQDAPDTPAPLDPARRAAAPRPACQRTSCAPVLVPLYTRLSWSGCMGGPQQARARRSWTGCTSQGLSQTD